MKQIKPIFFGLFCLLFFQTNGLFAQKKSLPFTPIDTIAVQDSTLFKSKGNLQLPLPASLISKYQYNELLQVYELVGGLSGYQFDLPLVLSPKDYWAMVEKENIQAYFKEKIAAMSGDQNAADLSVRNLLPTFSLQNDLLKTIFGGDEISFDAQGSVGVDMGILWQKNDNPALSPRNRSNLSFDFEQQISLNLMGKIGERLSVNASYDTQATFDFKT